MSIINSREPPTTVQSTFVIPYDWREIGELSDTEIRAGTVTLVIALTLFCLCDSPHLSKSIMFSATTRPMRRLTAPSRVYLTLIAQRAYLHASASRSAEAAALEKQLRDGLKAAMKGKDRAAATCIKVRLFTAYS